MEKRFYLEKKPGTIFKKAKKHPYPSHRPKA
jgi:hypothetical protein